MVMGVSGLLVPLYVVIGLLGLAFGSFGTVLTTRIPAGDSVIFTRSHCRSCGHNLAWFENIPLISWLIQGGRCQACKARVSVQYPLIEAATALLFVASFVLGGLGFTGLALAGLAVVTAPLIVIDYRHHRLPNPITYSLAAWELLVALAQLAFTGNVGQFWVDVLSGLVPCAALLLIALASRGGMGLGDVKLALGMGAALGSISAVAAASGFVLAFLIGGLVAALALATRRKNLKSALAFGPFMLYGAWLSVLLGSGIQGLIVSPWMLG